MISFRSVLVFVLFLAVTVSVFAQDSDTIKNTSAKSQVKIQSDTMRYYGKDKKSVFSGNVVATSDNFTLTSDNVTVILGNDMEAERILCTGNVNFKSDDIVAVSKEAQVDQLKKEALLIGDVKIWQGENQLEGEQVTIHYEDNVIIVDKRVRIIFNPDDNTTGKNIGIKSSAP